MNNKKPIFGLSSFILGELDKKVPGYGNNSNQPDIFQRFDIWIFTLANYLIIQPFISVKNRTLDVLKVTLDPQT